MDFETVLKSLAEGFGRRGIRCAAMGGFAMGLWGVQRATNDLDFLVHRDDLEKLHLLMAELGYRRVHSNENVSQYSGESSLWGHVDFIHAFRPLSLRVLREAPGKPALPDGTLLRVLRLEDVIGFKVQAMANNPAREAREKADIEDMVRSGKGGLDWRRIRDYYELFGRGGEFEELRRRHA